MYLFMPLKIYFLTPLRFAVLLVYAHCLTPFTVARAPVLICCFPVKSHARRWIIYIDTARAEGIFVLIHNVEATQVRVRCGTARTLVSVHGHSLCISAPMQQSVSAYKGNSGWNNDSTTGPTYLG